VKKEERPELKKNKMQDLDKIPLEDPPDPQLDIEKGPVEEEQEERGEKGEGQQEEEEEWKKWEEERRGESEEE
jgi:hypothetical protein